VWRIAFVSLLFTAGTLAIFFYAQGRGLGLETARTMVVNLIVVLEIFYLFNVRFLHMTSITLRGALGTPAVLIAIGVVVAAQFAFTYAPFMQALFETRPIAIVDGIVIVAAGALFMLVLEAEKVVLRRLRLVGASTP
jgi:magnesium-transporting ATPase (P-type)